MRGGQSTWQVLSRALLASADPGWPPTQLYHGRKTTTSRLLPDIFAFPGTLVCVSKNTKLVPKPWMKTRLFPAWGSPQDPSFEEQLPSSPHRPSACGAPTPPGTPGQAHPRGRNRTWNTQLPRAALQSVLSASEPAGRDLQGRRQGRGASQPEPLQLTPAQRALPRGGEDSGSPGKPLGSGWQCAGPGWGRSWEPNPSSGVSALGQPSRRPPACPA